MYNNICATFLSPGQNFYTTWRILKTFWILSFRLSHWVGRRKLTCWKNWSRCLTQVYRIILQNFNKYLDTLYRKIRIVSFPPCYSNRLVLKGLQPNMKELQNISMAVNLCKLIDVINNHLVKHDEGEYNDNDAEENDITTSKSKCVFYE